MKPLLLLLLCVLPGMARAQIGTPRDEVPPKVKSPTVQVVDSIFISGSFTAPASDGKGVLDSIRVDVTGLQTATIPVVALTLSKTWKPAPAAGSVQTYAFRVAAPSAVGNGGSATYLVLARVWTFRRALATSVVSVGAPIVIADVPPPAATANVLALVPWP